MKQPTSRIFNGFGMATCLLMVFGLPLGATTYVLMSDESIADQAPVIAEIEIVKVLESRWSEPPMTSYFGIVQRVLKGQLGSTITIQVPGGEGPDGLRLHIPSAPEFEDGEKVLLFLVPNADGSYEILHWSLGTFRVRDARNHQFVVRDLTEANVLFADKREEILFRRDYERFASWLEDRAAKNYREANYFEPLNLTAYIEPYTLFRWRGKNLRWFEFDRNSAVNWRLRRAGSDGSRLEFKRALRAWNREKKTPLNLVYAGSTKNRAGFTRSDGINAIIFGDPNKRMPGRFDCSKGGILATGGWWTNGISGTFRGRSYYRIIEGDIVVNNGADCWWRLNRKLASQIFSHELGHSLGIRHSCGDAASGACNTSRKNKAIMRAQLHANRGAALRADDKAALRRLYR